jgi:hypothetical protein
MLKTSSVNYTHNKTQPRRLRTKINILFNDKMLHLAKTFNCKTRSSMFTYLVLPLSLTKPKIVDFFPLIQRVGNICALHPCSSPWPST